MFLGFGDTLVEGTKKREIWDCQTCLNRTYLSFVCNIRKDISKSANSIVQKFLVPLFTKSGEKFLRSFLQKATNQKYFLQKATYKLELNHGCGFCAFVSFEVGFSLEAAQ